MARLSLALMLALGSHVLFFFIALPGQREDFPVIRGIRQVTVHIVHPAPGPVAEMEEVVRTAEPETAMVEKKVVAEIAEPEHIEEQVNSKPPQLKPEKRKEITPPNPVKVKENKMPEKKDVQQVVGHKREENKITESKQSISDHGEFSHAGTEAAAVQQAMVLYEINQPPEYPALARRRGWEGTVLLEVEVKSDGLVKSVRIQAGSSYSLLDDAAMEAVKKWRFKPGTQGGRPVAMKVFVPVHFLLKDK